MKLIAVCNGCKKELKIEHTETSFLDEITLHIEPCQDCHDCSDCEDLIRLEKERDVLHGYLDRTNIVLDEFVYYDKHGAEKKKETSDGPIHNNLHREEGLSVGS